MLLGSRQLALLRDTPQTKLFKSGETSGGIILMVLAWRNIVDTAGLENECCRVCLDANIKIRRRAAD